MSSTWDVPKLTLVPGSARCAPALLGMRLNCPLKAHAKVGG